MKASNVKGIYHCEIYKDTNILSKTIAYRFWDILLFWIVQDFMLRRF